MLTDKILGGIVAMLLHRKDLRNKEVLKEWFDQDECTLLNTKVLSACMGCDHRVVMIAIKTNFVANEDYYYGSYVSINNIKQNCLFITEKTYREYYKHIRKPRYKELYMEYQDIILDLFAELDEQNAELYEKNKKANASVAQIEELKDTLMFYEGEPVLYSEKLCNYIGFDHNLLVKILDSYRYKLRGYLGFADTYDYSDWRRKIHGDYLTQVEKDFFKVMKDTEEALEGRFEFYDFTPIFDRNKKIWEDYKNEYAHVFFPVKPRTRDRKEGDPENFYLISQKGLAILSEAIADYQAKHNPDIDKSERIQLLSAWLFAFSGLKDETEIQEVNKETEKVFRVVKNNIERDLTKKLIRENGTYLQSWNYPDRFVHMTTRNYCIAMRARTKRIEERYMITDDLTQFAFDHVVTPVLQEHNLNILVNRKSQTSITRITEFLVKKFMIFIENRHYIGHLKRIKKKDMPQLKSYINDENKMAKEFPQDYLQQIKNLLVNRLEKFGCIEKKDKYACAYVD